MTVDTATRAAELYEQTRFHKRELAWHRRALRERMEELRRFCETAGIDFIEVTEGKDAHGQRHDRSD